MSQTSNLNDPVLTKLLIAVMVRKLGGSISITQSEIDEVAYNRLEEQALNGTLEFRLVERKKAS